MSAGRLSRAAGHSLKHVAFRAGGSGVIAVTIDNDATHNSQDTR